MITGRRGGASHQRTNRVVSGGPSDGQVAETTTRISGASDEPPLPWAKSHAKNYLETCLKNPNDIIFLQNLQPEAVMHLSPLFKSYKKNFKANYS